MWQQVCAGLLLFMQILGDLELAHTPAMICWGVAKATHTWREIQSSRRERCWQAVAARDLMNPSRCRGDRRRRGL